MFRTVLTDLATARRRVRRVWRAVRRRPLRAISIALGVWLVVSIGGGNAMIAMAATDADGNKVLPFLSPLFLTDTSGVPMANYVVLPYDHGGIPWAIDDWFFSRIIDPVWLLHVVWIDWMLWLLHFLLSFEWISWIAAPLESMFTVVGGALSSIGWIPLALAIAALILTVQIIRGRTGSGVAETGVSIVAAAIATALLTNPIALLTSDDGAFTTVHRYGGSFAAAIATDNAEYLNSPPTGAEASDVIADTLAGQVIDVWVRFPAQEIMYGHMLSGDCGIGFNGLMTEREYPLDGNDSKIRDTIKQCDQEAGFNAENPNWGTLMSALSMVGGAIILLALNFVVGILLFMAVLYVAWNVYKLVFATYAAVIPGVARRAVATSAMSVVTGLLITVMVVCLIAVSLRLVTSIVFMLSQAGWPIIAQMWVVNIITLIMLGALVVISHRMKKNGQKLADRMKSRSKPKANPVRAQMGRTVQRYAGGSTAMKIAGSAMRGGIAGGVAAAGAVAMKKASKKRGATTPQGSKAPTAPTTHTDATSSAESASSTATAPNTSSNTQPMKTPADTALPTPAEKQTPQLRIVPDGKGGATATRDKAPLGRPPRSHKKPSQPAPTKAAPTQPAQPPQLEHVTKLRTDLARVRDGLGPENWAGWDALTPKEQAKHTRRMERDLIRARQASTYKHSLQPPQWGGPSASDPSPLRERLRGAISQKEKVTSHGSK